MVGLIRPYLKYSAYHYGLKVQKEASSTKLMLDSTTEPWMHAAVLETAWSRLYTKWEANIRTYLRDQREWNGFEDDFDWTLGDLETTERAAASLKCFGVEVSTAPIAEIKKKKVASVEDYLLKSREVETFWYRLEEFETFRLEPYP